MPYDTEYFRTKYFDVLRGCALQRLRFFAAGLFSGCGANVLPDPPPPDPRPVIHVVSPNNYTQYATSAQTVETVFDAHGQVFKLRVSSNPDSEGVTNYTGAGKLSTNRNPIRVCNFKWLEWRGGAVKGEVSLTALTTTWGNQPGGYDNSVAILSDGDAVDMHRIVRDFRADRCWDGIRITKSSSQAIGQRHRIEGCWVSNARDDAVENDSYASMDIVDCLFDDVFCGPSCSGDGAWSSHFATDSVDLNGVLMKLHGFPSSNAGVPFNYCGKPYKCISNSPRMTWRDTIVAFDSWNATSAAESRNSWVLMWNTKLTNITGDCRLLWLGAGAMPDVGAIPGTVTQMTGQPAIDYWDAARAAWLASHPNVDRLDIDTE